MISAAGFRLPWVSAAGFRLPWVSAAGFRLPWRGFPQRAFARRGVGFRSGLSPAVASVSEARDVWCTAANLLFHRSIRSPRRAFARRSFWSPRRARSRRLTSGLFVASAFWSSQHRRIASALFGANDHAPHTSLP
jgi:hypothetical protein